MVNTDGAGLATICLLARQGMGHGGERGALKFVRTAKHMPGGATTGDLRRKRTTHGPRRTHSMERVTQGAPTRHEDEKKMPKHLKKFISKTEERNQAINSKEIEVDIQCEILYYLCNYCSMR